MKICRFNDGRLGVVSDKTVYDVTEAAELLDQHRWPFPPGDLAVARLAELVAAIEGRRANGAAYDIGDVTLLSPVASPAKIIGAPLNYEEHVAEAGKDPGLHHGTHQTGFEGFASPIAKYGLFLKAANSVVGAGEGVEVIFPDRRTDHEVELAVVIGRQAKNIPEEDALGVVAGYCIGLDMSVRGTEARSLRKSPDGYTVLGPWLTTADEIADPGNLDLRISVNGKIQQHSNTRQLTVSVPALIALASRWYTLYPGDVILTGTPEGVGPVGAGDVMEASIDGLGSMRVEVR